MIVQKTFIFRANDCSKNIKDLSYSFFYAKHAKTKYILPKIGTSSFNVELYVCASMFLFDVFESLESRSFVRLFLVIN